MEWTGFGRGSGAKNDGERVISCLAGEKTVLKAVIQHARCVCTKYVFLYMSDVAPLMMMLYYGREVARDPIQKPPPPLS